MVKKESRKHNWNLRNTKENRRRKIERERERKKERKKNT
jgi:hypothetical protein